MLPQHCDQQLNREQEFWEKVKVLNSKSTIFFSKHACLWTALWLEDHPIYVFPWSIPLSCFHLCMKSQIVFADELYWLHTMCLIEWPCKIVQKLLPFF